MCVSVSLCVYVAVKAMCGLWQSDGDGNNVYIVSAQTFEPQSEVRREKAPPLRALAARTFGTNEASAHTPRLAMKFRKFRNPVAYAQLVKRTT